MWWLFAVAFAAPPEGIDLDDPAPWEEASRLLFDGPPGCWEIVGKATWNHDGARFGVSRGVAAFAGRLEDGVWSDDLHVEPLGEIIREGVHDTERLVYRDDAHPFVPLLGRHAADEEGEGPSNVMDEALGRIQGEARYTWVKWDDEHGDLVFTEVVPVGDRPDAPEITIDVRFPGGGQLPSRADYTFPERMQVLAMPPVFVRNAHVELRGVAAGGRVFPAAEAYSADIGVLGMKFHSAQTIQYRSIRPCEVPPEPVPVPVPAPAPDPGPAPAEPAPDAETAKVTDPADQP